MSLRMDLLTFVNEEDGDRDLMGHLNCVSCKFGGKGREAKWSWVGGWSQFGPLVSQKLGPREKLPFEPQSAAYSSKPCLAISLIIS